MLVVELNKGEHCLVAMMARCDWFVIDGCKGIMALIHTAHVLRALYHSRSPGPTRPLQTV